MIENYLLEQFIGFVESGTLLKASEKLHISQPSLTRSMQKLEEEFGVSLFQRDNRKISLNETGKIAYEYAKKTLEANRQMIESVQTFDRSLRTISIGTCTPFPINELLPLLEERFIGKSFMYEIVDTDEKLIEGLKNHLYDLVILHQISKDKSLFCQRYLDEQLYISIAKENPLSKKKSLSFKDLKGLRILISGSVGFWMKICEEKLDASDLLIQNSSDALDELVDASSLPVFNSDQMIRNGYEVPGRVSIPVCDKECNVTYYVASLNANKTKYDSLFNAIRSSLIREI